MKIPKIYRPEGGYALILGLIFFIAGGTAVIAGLSDAIIREVKTIRVESLSKQSYFTSESSLEDAIYRVKQGKTIGTTETLVLASSSATTTLTTAADGSQTIYSAGDASGARRSTTASIDEGDTIGFDYALATGVGGIELQSGVSVTGDIYTSGSVTACGGCSVSGAVVAAATSTIYLDRDNSSPTTPAQSITFGNADGSQDIAQSFTVSSSSSLMDVQIYIKKVGNPANATIKITSDSGGTPNFYNPLTTGTLSSSLVGNSYTWMDITLTANPVLTAGTTYWIVIDGNPNPTSYYVAAANSSFAFGQGKVGRGDWNTWSNTSPSGLDLYFQAYTGSNKVGIAGQDEYNRFSVGSAYADQVSFVNASGAIYCHEGGSNNKSCDESRSDPSIESLPIPDSSIAGWKSEATAGGTVTSQSVGYAGLTLGPKKINGSLTVGGGGTLYVSGTLYVTGNVSIGGGGHVRSANGSKSFAIVADGTISLSGGASIDGGSMSHILLLSTSTADPAVSLDGGSNDTAVYAPYGTVRISGGASAKALAAKKLIISGGANVVYDSQMSDLNLSGGTSVGGTNIKYWKETE